MSTLMILDAFFMYVYFLLHFKHLHNENAARKNFFFSFEKMLWIHVEQTVEHKPVWTSYNINFISSYVFSCSILMRFPIHWEKAPALLFWKPVRTIHDLCTIVLSTEDVILISRNELFIVLFTATKLAESLLCVYTNGTERVWWRKGMSHRCNDHIPSPVKATISSIRHRSFKYNINRLIKSFEKTVFWFNTNDRLEEWTSLSAKICFLNIVFFFFRWVAKIFDWTVLLNNF